MAATLASLLCVTPAAAQVFPSRSGESGLLDVPDAEVVGAGNGALATELRFDERSGADPQFGPLPVYTTAGITAPLELGLSMRQGGQPGDPAARMLFGGALKLRLLGGELAPFSLAADGYVDRVNDAAVGGGRLILSTPARFPVRTAAFVGHEVGGAQGLTWGGAVSIATGPGHRVVLEALGGPRGENFGVALQRALRPAAVSLALNYFPGEEAFRVSVGFAFYPRRKERPPSPSSVAKAQAAPEEEIPAIARFLDDRPHFRMKIRMADALRLEARRFQHAPHSPAARVSFAAAPSSPASPATAAPAVAGAAGARPAVPSLDDLAAQQLRDQAALVDARQARVTAAAGQLSARDAGALEEARKLDARERDLSAREEALDARDRQIVLRAPPTREARELAALEAQLTAQQRNLGAQERSYVPAIDAAQRRERDAASRAEAEQLEANRLAAAASAGSSRAVQIDLQKQALGARSRHLAALEARLVANGERLDATERQLSMRKERLSAWQRRLDTKKERLDLVDRRVEEPKPEPAAPQPTGATSAPGATPQKDKAVFVTVVKSPTSIVKERSSGTAAAPASAPAGAAVEKAVAAATVVTFGAPGSQLSELDRETIDNIAKLAARDQCELLIWARAKDPGTLGEAQRRAAEVKARVLSTGSVAERQVVTRVTTRPGARGVDVVVSALRAASPASTQSAVTPAAAPGPGAPALQPGEAGKRQIREAVQAAQGSIESCVAEVMEQRRLPRVEGVLKLTLSAEGRVAKVHAEGELSGTGIVECLGSASAGWAFPRSDAEYVVDVPITVMRGGSR